MGVASTQLACSSPARLVVRPLEDPQSTRSDEHEQAGSSPEDARRLAVDTRWPSQPGGDGPEAKGNYGLKVPEIVSSLCVAWQNTQSDRKRFIYQSEGIR